MVAGVAALLLEMAPGLDANDLDATFSQDLSVDVGASGKDPVFGWGKLFLEAGLPFPWTPPDLDGDGLTDFLDNCPAIENAGQEDGDADDVGDLCDAHCAGFVDDTSITALTPASGGPGAFVTVIGTGFGPTASIHVGGGALATTRVDATTLLAAVVGFAAGDYSVEVVNPEGCRSLESVLFTVTPPGQNCGLGAELVLVLGGALFLQRRRTAGR